MGKKGGHHKKHKPNTITPVQTKVESSIEEHPDFVIDGQILEGGGQILRNTVALASLFHKNILINNIRYNRDQPGLKPQHKAGIELVTRLYKGHTNGCGHGSTRLYYQPVLTTITEQDIDADTKTAGSITLLIQIALPCFIFAPTSIKAVLGGGTNVDFSPPADYIVEVFNPIAKKFGINVDIQITKRGFYPRGGGAMTVITKPVESHLEPITMIEKGNLNKIVIKSYYTSKVSPLVAERMCNTAKKLLKKEFKKVEIDTEMIDISSKSFGDGTFIFITAYTDTGCIFGATANGSIGVPAETVAENATNSLIKDLQDGGCVDEYLQDQLIIFMALAKGKSQLKTGPISLHTQTSIHFTSLITGAKFTTEPINQRQPGEETFLITCEGVGFSNSKNNEEKKNTETTTTTTTTTSTTTTTNSS
eukprot:gene593-739_t